MATWVCTPRQFFRRRGDLKQHSPLSTPEQIDPRNRFCCMILRKTYFGWRDGHRSRTNGSRARSFSDSFNVKYSVPTLSFF